MSWTQQFIVAALVLTELTLAVGCYCPRPHLAPCDIQSVPPLIDPPVPSVRCAAVSIPETPDPRLLHDQWESLERWNLGIVEAIEIAFSNSQAVRTLGGLRPATQIDVGGTTPRVSSTQYDPAIEQARVLEAMGKFDTNFETGIFWERLENPFGATVGGILPNQPLIDRARFDASLTQLLTTGATAGIRYNTDYFFLPPGFGNVPQGLNPQYEPNLEFAIRQPFCRGFGPAVNVASINIAATKSDQSAWEFKRAMLALVRSIETAYWDLYAAEQRLAAIDSTIPLLQEVFRIERERLDVRAVISADVAQSESELLAFKAARLGALLQITQKQALLRNLMGLPPDDTRLVKPTEPPVVAPLVVDWDSSLATALSRRPDIVRGRLQVRVTDLELLLANNLVRPQIDGEALWRINGLGTDLNAASAVLNDSDFTDWRLGVFFRQPLQNRKALGERRARQLDFSRAQTLLRQTAHAATHELAAIVREMDWIYRQYEVVGERQKVNAIWLDGARQRFQQPIDVTLLLGLESYLRVMRDTTATKIEAAELLARYNIGLARLEEAKGTLLDMYNIHIAGDQTDSAQDKMAPIELENAEEVLPHDEQQKAPELPPPTPPQPGPANLE